MGGARKEINNTNVVMIGMFNRQAKVGEDSLNLGVMQLCQILPTTVAFQRPLSQREWHGSWVKTQMLTGVSRRGSLPYGFAHFGRFNRLTEALWSFLGILLAVLFETGVFVCCRRMICKKNSNPNYESE